MSKHQACPKCPSSDAYWEYEDGHGYCFSCNTYFPAPLKKRIQRAVDIAHNKKDEANKSSNTTVINTSGWTRHLRADALAWLLKYRLTADEIKSNDIFWDTGSQSLVFVIAWLPTTGSTERSPKIAQYRSFSNSLGKLPKYLTTGPKSSYYKIYGQRKQLILVEDVVSAIKVARTDSSIPLLGTSVNYSLILKIKDNYDRIDVWLDPDKRKESLAISLQLNQYGIKSSPIFSQNDPKTDIQ
jgi:hypothetical protein